MFKWYKNDSATKYYDEKGEVFMKQVSFSLLPRQAGTYKSLVDSSMQSKILRNYILHEYQLPEQLSIINEGDKKGLKLEKFLFDEPTNIRLNELVKYVRKNGYIVNRSSLMRHILSQLITNLKKNSTIPPKERAVRPLNFYFKKGTKEVLEQFVSFRNRNAVIERFILEDYKPSDVQHLLDKPKELEQMRIGVDRTAIEKLDEFVENIAQKGVTRTALMRDVVEKIIAKLSNTDTRKLIAETRLQNALFEYEQAFGKDVLREQLYKYVTYDESDPVH